MNNPQETETDEQSIPFNLTFSLDRDGFMRRTCPSCGRDFKTEANASDFAASLQPYFSEAGLEIGAGEEGGNGEEATYLRCPYCGHDSKASEMITEELANYVKRLILREHILPMMNKELRQMADSFGGGSKNSFLSISFDHNPPPRPARPISGPEPPDMIIVHLLCCTKRVKIAQGWHGLHQCPYCDTNVQIRN